MSQKFSHLQKKQSSSTTGEFRDWLNIEKCALVEVNSECMNKFNQPVRLYHEFMVAYIQDLVYRAVVDEEADIAK